MSFRDRNRFLEQHSETLKKEKIFIRTVAPRPVGTRVRLVILLETEDESITAEGEIVQAGVPRTGRWGPTGLG